MIILSIESSCDETAASVIEDGVKIISSAIASSKDIHAISGGIIPEVAAREQLKCILPVIEKAVRRTQKFTNNNPLSFFSFIDAIAVTIGPGLIGALLIGIETAKTISYITKIPIIPVNHILAHLYANWLEKETLPTFPAVGLVVSGGHTEIYLLKNHHEFVWLGGTRDDAAGETFDKTARLLGLPYPGGPAIAVEAVKFKTQSSKIKLPRPMIDSGTLEFSFSGLKTAVLREIGQLKALKQYNNRTISNMAYEIQESITDVLVEKTLLAAKMHKVKSIILGGGVAANHRLTTKFKLKIENSKSKIDFRVPPPSLCTDNASYIGSYAYFHNKPLKWHQIHAEPNLEVEV